MFKWKCASKLAVLKMFHCIVTTVMPVLTPKLGYISSINFKNSTPKIGSWDYV